MKTWNKGELSNLSLSISDAICLKRAVRIFTPDPLPESTIIAITDKEILKQLSKYGDWAGHLVGAALGVAILHTDPGEKFQIMFDIGQATSHIS